MRKLMAVVLAAGLFGVLATVPASATKPEPDHKVWVCHVVNGKGELGNGYNLIHVDAAAVPAHLSHVANDGRRDIVPAPGGENSDCTRPAPPTTVVPSTTTEKPAPTTTTEQPVTTSTTEKPAVPTTVLPPVAVPPSPVVETSSTAIAIVLPEAQPAEAQQAEPSFTG